MNASSNFRKNVKRMMIATMIFTVAVLLFLTHALAGLNAKEVTFAPPPTFVDEYASKLKTKLDVESASGTESQPFTQNEQTKVKLTKDYFNEAALVRKVIVNGESSDELIRLFSHPDKAQRVKIAFAFGEVNFKLSHDEGTGFDEKRKQFWKEAEEHSAAIQNALFEALIASAEESSWNDIPYTLAWWMPEQKSKAVEMLAWAAKHHPDTWIRNFSVYYVVQFSGDETHAAALISDRIHDPVFRVRKQVLEQRVRRFKEMVFGTEA